MLSIREKCAALAIRDLSTAAAAAEVTKDEPQEFRDSTRVRESCEPRLERRTKVVKAGRLFDDLRDVIMAGAAGARENKQRLSFSFLSEIHE